MLVSGLGLRLELELGTGIEAGLYHEEGVKVRVNKGFGLDIPL